MMPIRSDPDPQNIDFLYLKLSRMLSICLIEDFLILPIFGKKMFLKNPVRIPNTELDRATEFNKYR
jgi:hypothetical protein